MTEGEEQDESKELLLQAQDYKDSRVELSNGNNESSIASLRGENKSSLISQKSAESLDGVKKKEKKTITFHDNYLGLPETSHTHQTYDDRAQEHVLI